MENMFISHENLLYHYRPQRVGYEDNIILYDGGSSDKPIEFVLAAMLDMEDFDESDVYKTNEWMGCIDCIYNDDNDENCYKCSIGY